MKLCGLLVLFLVAFAAIASDESPYAGEHKRSIKSLSASEIASLRRGDGMGYAKVAELNHFPGPKHVLDLQEQLGLNVSQLEATTALYEEMLKNAVATGNELIAAEQELSESFETELVTLDSLEKALTDIGQIESRLRNIHLRTHLQQRDLLSDEQIQKYDMIRGYDGDVRLHEGHDNAHSH